MTEIRLSIIIPHYNSAVLLKKLLSTIPNVPEIQTIVVDDHSTDKLDELELCKTEYRDTNVEFYVNEFRKSAGGARNTGLKYAKGQWLLFADADDYFLYGFYGIVEKYFDKSYDMVFFTPTSLDLTTLQVTDRHQNTKLLIDNYLEKPNKRNELRLKYMVHAPWSKLIRRELFDEYRIMFDETLVANDVIASMKVAYHAGSIAVSEEVIYCVTKQQGTLTTGVTEKRYDERMEVYYRKHKYLKEKLSSEDYNLLHFDARTRLKQIKQYKFGRKKYFSVLREMIKQGVPIWREFSLSYYRDVIIFLLKKRKHRK